MHQKNLYSFASAAISSSLVENKCNSYILNNVPIPLDTSLVCKQIATIYLVLING